MREAARIHPAWRYVAAAGLGGTFALGVSQALQTLEPRYVAALVAAMCLVAAACVMAARLRDLLLYLLAFNLPFTSIEKTFAISPDTTFVTPGIAVGLADLTWMALVAIWLARVAVLRVEPWPRPSTVDKLLLAFVLAHAVSALTSVSPALTIYETIRLSKYAIVCVYVEHNLRREHFRYLIAGICLALVLQASLGVVQQRTGRLLGIGRTKGAALEYEQYTVTGFEAVRRAEGTTFDSHALALFFAMTLALPLGLALTPEVRRAWRVAAAAVTLVGLMGLVVAFARAGWVAFAASALVLMACLVRWGEYRRVALGGLAAAVIGVAALVPFAGQVRQRLFDAPPELVTARFETIEMSLDIWRDSPWTGIGANAYMRALELKFSIFEGDPYFIPAHNMVVFLMTEIGVLGLAVFLGLSVAIARTLWRATYTEDRVLRVLAAALLGGFVAFHVEGLFDPIYATNVVYFLFWFLVGLGLAVARLGGPVAVPVAAPRRPRQPFAAAPGIRR